MSMKSILFSLAAATIAAGCASAPPKELVHARAAYDQASAGPAAQLAPAELHVAQQALAKAEASFDKDPEGYQTRDLAYVAHRKAQLAGTKGVMAANTSTKSESERAFQKKQGELVAKGKQDLADAEAASNEAKHAAAADKSSQELAASEARTAAAVAALAELATVKEEERGLVVTLSGSILFRSSESSLLPAAKTKLVQVAGALLAVEARNIVVEGHTDSQGSDAYNLGLSQRRADSVRNYLVQQSYPTDRIEARGMGEGNPIADNGNAEGRANNRRVEIVIERELTAANQ